MSSEPPSPSGPDLMVGIPVDSLAEGVPVLGHVDGVAIIVVRRGEDISMTSPEQIDEYLGASGWQSTARGDLPLLERYARMNGSSQCRQGSGACLSACPSGVAIDEVLRARMYAVDYGDPALARSEYASLTAGAAPCLSCAAQPCRGACPHGLPVERLLAPAHRMLTD